MHWLSLLSLQPICANLDSVRSYHTPGLDLNPTWPTSVPRTGCYLVSCPLSVNLMNIGQSAIFSTYHKVAHWRANSVSRWSFHWHPGKSFSWVRVWFSSWRFCVNTGHPAAPGPRPHRRSEAKDHITCLECRLPLWDMPDSMKGGCFPSVLFTFWPVTVWKASVLLVCMFVCLFVAV